MRECPWEVGDVIRKLRLCADWTLDDLNERCDVSFTAISRIELGITKEPKRGTLTKIAAAFGLTLREFEDLIPTTPVRLNVAFPLPGSGGIDSAALAAEVRRKANFYHNDDNKPLHRRDVAAKTRQKHKKAG